MAAPTHEHGGWESRLRDGHPASAAGSSALFLRAERAGTSYSKDPMIFPEWRDLQKDKKKRS
jgi:hypothetical protein